MKVSFIEKVNVMQESNKEEKNWRQLLQDFIKEYRQIQIKT